MEFVRSLYRVYDEVYYGCCLCEVCLEFMLKSVGHTVDEFGELNGVSTRKFQIETVE